MPQVFFNTDTFKGDRFPPNTEENMYRLSEWACREHPEMGRKINKPWTLYLVPNFMEALRDKFDGWHLHHVAGELVPRRVLVEQKMYERRPWWELRFMNILDHRRIHTRGNNGQEFRSMLYSAEPAIDFASFVKSCLQDSK